MHENLLLCLALILCASFLVMIARKISMPYPIFLVIAGLVLSFIPWIPNIQIDPEVVFLIILPPILFDAAQNTSWKALWKWRRIVSFMAFGYVMLTATIAALVSCWLIPGFSMANGFLLGAIISPPDAAAATAVLKKVSLPKGLVAILEGESLLNDATSLTVYRFALAAVMTNQFVWHQAFGTFLLVVISGIAIGFVFGLAFYGLYKWLPTTSNLDIALSFVFPYSIYMAAEALQSSGVLAVVTGGLYIAYQNHHIFSHNSRLKSNAVWPAIIFILNSVVFFLIGLQLKSIGAGALNYPNALRIALLVSLAVIITRLISGHLSGLFTSFISRYIIVALKNPGWRRPMVISWAGMRGIVSLASALAIPLTLPGGQSFPYRPLILFITFVVVIVTLVGQGLALPWVVRVLKPEPIPGEVAEQQQLLEIEMKLFAIAVDKLKTDHQDEVNENGMLKNKMEQLIFNLGIYQDFGADANKKEEALAMIMQFRKIMMLITEYERKHLHQFRRKEGFDDDIIRVVESRLDLDEQRIDNGIK